MIRAFKLWRIHSQMREVAGHLNWLHQNVNHGMLEIRKYEDRQKRLHADAWLLERPKSILMQALRRQG